MATSGAMSTTNKYIKYKITVTQQSQSVTGNTSTVKVSVRFYRTNTGYTTYGNGTVYCKINGTTYSAAVTSDDKITNSGIVLFTRTLTIAHNADGTKTLATSAWISHSQFSASEQSYSQALTTIPRATKPTLSASSIELGKSVTITLSRASSSFTHKLYYGWYGTSYVLIASDVATSYTWTLPLTFANNIPDATSGRGTIRCETYNGSTKIGTVDVTFTGTVPASMVPGCSVQVLDDTDTKDTYGNLVKGLSKLYVKVTGTPSYNSPIMTYSTTANGSKYTAAEFVTGIINAAGTTTVTATVTDKRGRTKTASASFPVLDYNPPSITSLAVHRCDEDGTENPEGGYIKATFSAAITALNNKNSAAYTLRYKQGTATSWTSVTLTAYAGKYTVTNGTHIFAASADNTYDVEIIAKDDMSSYTRATSASTAFTLINFKSSGTGIAFGKVSELAKAFECALRMYDEYGLRVNNGVASYGGSASPIDADTTLEHVFLTTVNVPDSRFWYVIQVFYSGKTDTGNRAQIAIPYSFDGPIHKRHHYGGNGWSAWKTEAEADDSGWIDMSDSLKSAFTVYGGNSNPPEYRRNGMTVNVRGQVSPASDIAGTSTRQVLFTLPQGYRPTRELIKLCQGSGNYVWELAVRTDGAVCFCRYRSSAAADAWTYETAPAGAWLPFEITYLIT